MIWPFVGILAFVIFVALIWPVWRPVRMMTVAERRRVLLSRFESEKVRINTACETGMLDKPVARDALAELERRTVRDLDSVEEEATQIRSHPLWAFIIFGGGIGCAMGLYAYLGTPSMPRILSQHYSQIAEQQQLNQLVVERRKELDAVIEKFSVHVAANPDDVLSVSTLGRAYIIGGYYDEAVAVLEKGLKRHAHNADIHAFYAEALILRSESGQIPSVTLSHIEKALEINPEHHIALYYRGWLFFMEGNAPQTIDVWRRLLAVAPSDAPYQIEVTQRLAALEKAVEGRISVAPEISTQDVENAQGLSNEDRAEFIDSMVARLADRLKTNPNDVEGWLRLAQAYKVLNQPENAISAYKSLLEVQPDHLQAQEGLAALLAQQ